MQVSGHTQNLNFEPTGDYNEYGGGDLRLDAQEFAEALLTVRENRPWSKETFRLSWDRGGSSSARPLRSPRPSLMSRYRRRRLPAGTLSMRIGGSIYSSPASATLGQYRVDVLLLDAYEAAFCEPKQARSGMQLPAERLDSAFLDTLRANPQHLSQLKTVGLERTILGLMNEVGGGAIRLERLDPDGSMLLARPSGGSRGAMLLYVERSGSNSVNIDMVDRINGVRDRHSVTKAAVITRSHFSADTEKAYEGMSHRMELVDYDRLRGVLTDSGWTAHSPGFLTLPVADRPPHAVFISYSWQQRGFAQWLYNKLHGWQYNCFLDNVNIAAGDVILSSVQKALAGADAVVLCCSEAALSSQWVQIEIEACLAREKHTGKKILLPVRLDDSRFEGELAVLNDRLILDFRDWDKRGPGDEDRLSGLVDAIDGMLRQGAPS